MARGLNKVKRTSASMPAPRASARARQVASPNARFNRAAAPAPKPAVRQPGTARKPVLPPPVKRGSGMRKAR